MSQIKVNSIVPVAGVPTGGGGGIVQIVQDVLDTTASFTSLAYQTQTFTDTGLSATITPTSTSSKIYVLATIYHASQASTNTARFNLVRGSTNIAQPANSPAGSATSINYLNTISMITTPISFLDSPSTTSATTYKIQISFDVPGSNITHYINRYHGADLFNGISTLTLMEVSA